MKKVLYLLIGAVFIAGSIYLFLQEPAPPKYIPKTTEPQKYEEVTVGNVPIRAEIARSIEERKEGLSDRDGLPENEGMLFDFGESGTYGIWMKDMKFSLDILWVSGDMSVTTIKENISPETYPEVFYSDGEARYVLELPAGFVNDHNIQIGDKVNLKT
jgi:uncharacterized membrane protein (UPF0127 family)